MIVFGKHAVTRLVARQQLLPSMLELNEFPDRGKHKNRNNSATYQDIYDPFVKEQGSANIPAGFMTRLGI